MRHQHSIATNQRMAKAFETQSFSTSRALARHPHSSSSSDGPTEKETAATTKTIPLLGRQNIKKERQPIDSKYPCFVAVVALHALGRKKEHPARLSWLLFCTYSVNHETPPGRQYPLLSIVCSRMQGFRTRMLSATCIP